MLDKIREGVHGPAAKIVLSLIILSFAFAGVSSYMGGNNAQPAAVVNGEEISPRAFEAAYQNERARMEQQFGQLFNQLASDSAYMQRFRASVLERLIDEVVTDQAADELGLTISDEQIKSAIKEMPQFQVNGQFSNDVYLSTVRRQNMSTSQFREYLRREMTRRQLLQALIATDFVTEAELKQRYMLDNQTRDIRLVTIDSATLLGQVEPSDEELQQAYEMQAQRFVTPEQIALEYIELKVSDLAATQSVSDDEINAYYSDNSALYMLPEQRKVAHILLPAEDSEKAATLVSELAAGADFAELAKANSIDTFSGENGGELDWFERGTYGEDFDDASFALAVGDVSAPVETTNGIHLIKLLDVKPSVQQPLAEVTDSIALQLKKQKAESDFIELQTAMTNVAFEVPDTLEDAANAAGLEVQKTALFSRESAPAPFNNGELLNAAFSETVLLEGLNSDAIEVGGEQVIIVRLLEHKPSAQLTFDEVKPQLLTDVKRRLAGEKADAIAAELTEKLLAGEDVTALLTENSLAFEEKLALTRYGSDVAPAVRDAAFALAPSTDGTASAEQASIPGGKYAVVELLKVNTATSPEPAQLTALEAQVSPQLIEQAYQPLIAMLRDRAEISYPVVATETLPQ
ncbi:SurA N-terminal domain-containing protein [Corallincola spongiicola]|uniref:Periplasmic chaperone PpiD n=1 Tax=Corallincola spongiicola TaxID=2520508 RepID=A0ABY1WMM9_9GAMM|nr:SurA N-terminal domain-containing protein [Corallincola spongiicola]TAA42733.1 peptidylprolyl isomerase [Corallincola spongiicola]